MFQNFIQQYQQQSSSLQGMLFLRWINQVRTIVIAVFSNIYIFQFNQQVEHLVIGNMLYLFHSMIGFLIGWWCIHTRSTNLKHLFYAWFVVMATAFAEVLLFWNHLWGIYLFFALAGTGSGLFYFASVNYETTDLGDDSSRNFFTSTYQAGNGIVKIILPLLISAMFLLASWWWRNGYHLLFGFTWLVYVYGITYVHYIPDYIIAQQPMGKLKTYFNSQREYIGAWLFFFFYWAHNIINVLLSLILVFILKNEINIGIYESLLGVLGVLSLIFISTKTTKQQRAKMFFTLSILYACIATLVGRHISMTTLVIYSVGAIIIHPIIKGFRSSFHYTHQEAIKKYNTYHYGIIFGEIMVTAGRIFFLSIVLFLSYIVSLEYLIAIGMTLFSLNYLYLYRNTQHYLSDQK